MYFHKPQQRPPLWGNFQDRQYSIWRNLEKIYDCDHESEVLITPLFWGLPPLDYSEKANHGTNYGATYKDGSLDFDGNDYIDCGTKEGLNITGELTLFVRFRANSDYTSNQALIGNAAIGSECNYVITFGYTANKIELWNTFYGPDIVSTLSIIDNLWRDIIITRAGSAGDWTLKIYIKGQIDKTDTTINNPQNPVNSMTAIGRFGAYVGYYAKNLIDEVRISNVVRTADQAAMFHDLPYGLYQPVSRPIWSIPAAAPSIFIPRIVIC